MHAILPELAAQGITLRVIEPDPASQPVLCPNQTLVYECTVDGYVGLVWTLPTSRMTDNLVFTAVSEIGATRNVSKFVATLNSREPVGNDALVMTSTLIISPPLNAFNGLPLTCTGRSAEIGMDEMEMTNVTVSGE